MKRSPAHFIVSVSMLIAACGDSGAEAGTTTASSASTTSITIGSSITTETSMSNESNLVDAAVADLATRLGISDENVEVLRVESVSWPDAALGCPEEGEMYAQVMVEGTRVLLQVDDRIYDFHAGSDGNIFLCPSEDRDGGYDFVPPPGDPER